MEFAKFKAAIDPAQTELIEALRARFTRGQLEVFSSWTQASELEMARWARSAETVEHQVEDLPRLGASHTLVDQLLEDRAYRKSSGIYFAPGARGTDLVYAVRRLLMSGQKVVFLDWDAGSSAEEQLLELEVPTFDILQGFQGFKATGGSESVQLQVPPAAGSSDPFSDAAKDDLEWTMTVERAGQLMQELEGADVLVFLASPTAVEEVPGSELEVSSEALAMSARTFGNLAGTWGASILVGGGEVVEAHPETWADTLAVLVSSMTMAQYR